MQRGARKVVVAGDIVIEWRLAKSKIGKRMADGLLFDPKNYIQLSVEPSGAVSLGQIIGAALGRKPAFLPNATVSAPAAAAYEQTTIRGAYWNSHVLCAQFPEKRGNDSGAQPVWRIEKKLGIDRMPENALKKAPPQVRGDDGRADLVVVEQSKHGFESERHLWPRSLEKPEPGAWLLARWSRPQFGGSTEFWKHILDNFGERFAVVVNADHLRYFGMRVSRSLSWERTVEELFTEVSRAWDDSLHTCRHFIVSFFPSGVVLFTKDGRSPLTAQLFYDPAEIGSSWADEYEGLMMGFTRCLTAGIALEMLGSTNRAMLDGAGIIAGMVASRELLRSGFKERGKMVPSDTSLPEALVFPTDTVAGTLYDVLQARAGSGAPGTADPSAAFQVFGPISNKPGWRILDSQLGTDGESLENARDILEHGSENRVWKFPTLRIGKLFVTDRVEMENLLAVRELIVNYLSSPLISKPLSIAVFGPPGAGKSFAIKELAKELSKSRSGGAERIDDITFNVSQFTSPASIAGALQQVRDIGLSGKLPLVFWDEFDSDSGTVKLPWLRSFLAPMQDGQFQDEQMMHNVGRAIFVFGGGTKDTFDRFVVAQKKRDVDHAADRRGPESALESDEPPWVYTDDAKEAKVPDFVSRLKGFVNVPTLQHPPGKLNPAIALRRAGLLRSFLMDSSGDLVQFVQSEPGGALRKRLNVDRGLADAFLTVSSFSYGARSIEAIVNMSVLSGKTMYDRSSLPPQEQLELHVDPIAFLSIVDQTYAAPE